MNISSHCPVPGRPNPFGHGRPAVDPFHPRLPHGRGGGQPGEPWTGRPSVDPIMPGRPPLGGGGPVPGHPPFPGHPPVPGHPPITDLPTVAIDPILPGQELPGGDCWIGQPAIDPIMPDRGYLNGISSRQANHALGSLYSSVSGR